MILTHELLNNIYNVYRLLIEKIIQLHTSQRIYFARTTNSDRICRHNNGNWDT